MIYYPPRRSGIQNVMVAIKDEILTLTIDLKQIVGPTDQEIGRRKRGEKDETDNMAVRIATTDGIKPLLDPEHPGLYRSERIQLNVTKDIPAPVPEALELLAKVMHHPNLDAWIESNPDNVRRILGAQADNFKGYATAMKRILKEMEEMEK